MDKGGLQKVKELFLKLFYFLEALYYFPRKSIYVIQGFRQYQNRYSRSEAIKKITQRILHAKIPKNYYIKEQSGQKQKDIL